MSQALLPSPNKHLGEDSYNPDMCRQAKMLAKMGATNNEIAEFLGISVPCFYRWRHIHPELASAVRLGKAEADRRVEESLYMRAVGYTYESEKLMAVAMGQGLGSEVQRHVTKEHVIPDVKAAVHWLNNRNPDKWKNRQETTHDGTVKFEPVQRDRLDVEA